jgi:hypothetical protein
MTALEATVPDSRPTQPSPAPCGDDCPHAASVARTLPLCGFCGKEAGEPCQGCGGANQKVTLTQIRRWRAIEAAAGAMLEAHDAFALSRRKDHADACRTTREGLRAAMREP